MRDAATLGAQHGLELGSYKHQSLSALLLGTCVPGKYAMAKATWEDAVLSWEST